MLYERRALRTSGFKSQAFVLRRGVMWYGSNRVSNSQISVCLRGVVSYRRHLVQKSSICSLSQRCVLRTPSCFEVSCFRWTMRNPVSSIRATDRDRDVMSYRRHPVLNSKAFVRRRNVVWYGCRLFLKSRHSDRHPHVVS